MKKPVFHSYDSILKFVEVNTDLPDPMEYETNMFIMPVFKRRSDKAGYQFPYENTFNFEDMAFEEKRYHKATIELFGETLMVWQEV